MAEAADRGAPLLRPMVWEFQEDEQTHQLDDQAMLGPWLLVAPVLEPGLSSRSVYLPQGRWFELHSGAAFEGPALVEERESTCIIGPGANVKVDMFRNLVVDLP